MVSLVEMYDYTSSNPVKIDIYTPPLTHALCIGSGKFGPFYFVHLGLFEVVNEMI